MSKAWIKNIPPEIYEAALKEFSQEIKFQAELLGYLKEYIDKEHIDLQEYTKCVLNEHTNQLHILFNFYIETEMKKRNLKLEYITLEELMK